MEYPSWRYHETLPACIVEDPEADQALGDGWADTPTAFTPAESAECSKSKNSKKKATP